MREVSVVWFRNDLRLDANPALDRALRCGPPVLCVYLYENGLSDIREPGAASKWWLNKSLIQLDNRLKEKGGRLFLKRCDGASPKEILQAISDQYKIQGIYWNRRYSPKLRNIDQDVKEWAKGEGITAESFNGSLLCEPWEIKTNDGNPYKVFTPFWKSLASAYERTHPEKLTSGEFVSDVCDDVTNWALHPTKPDWSTGLEKCWTPGEAGAHERLENFLENTLKGYDEKRDRPDKVSTSMLSPHLAFGEISPQQIWTATKHLMEHNSALESDGWAFLREIGWRDFSNTLLYQAENLAERNWNDRFDHFDWVSDDDLLSAWKKGQTGYPIVDAGMRQLWETGWMHNRVRMIVGSFLVKHLRIHWREGETWFWDTLVDADVANNPASWQWIAGSGADAAPYFRIFNPITQGEKFDPNGDYVRKWVPELTKLPNKFLQKPWEASKPTLRDAGVALGKHYPKPIVEHKRAREKALQAYEKTK